MRIGRLVPRGEVDALRFVGRIGGEHKNRGFWHDAPDGVHGIKARIRAPFCRKNHDEPLPVKIRVGIGLVVVRNRFELGEGDGFLRIFAAEASGQGRAEEEKAQQCGSHGGFLTPDLHEPFSVKP